MTLAIKHEIKHGIKHESSPCFIQEGNDDRLVGLVFPENYRIRDAGLHRGRSRFVALVASKEEEVMEYIPEKDILIQQLQDALYDALAYIEQVARDFGVVLDEDVLERITAALAAAKGE